MNTGPYRIFPAMLDPEVAMISRVDAVVDGDTYHLKVDVGPRDRKHVTCRLRNVDTAEIYGVDHDSVGYERGTEQMQFVRDWFEDADTSEFDWPLEIVCHSLGKYGRWVVSVRRRSDGQDLANRLRAEFDGI